MKRNRIILTPCSDKHVHVLRRPCQGAAHREHRDARQQDDFPPKDVSETTTGEEDCGAREGVGGAGPDELVATVQVVDDGGESGGDRRHVERVQEECDKHGAEG